MRALMAAERPRLSETAAFAMVTTAALCWAGNHIAGRWIAGESPPVPPGGLSALRWMLAFLVILPWAWRPIKADWPSLRERSGTVLALGLVGGAMFSFIQYYALQYTTAVNVGVMNSAAPAFIVLAGTLIFRDAVALRQLGGITVSLIGVLVILTRGDPRMLAGLQFNLGDLLALINMAIFGVYSVCLRLTPKLHVLTFVAALCLIASLGSVPVALIETLAGHPLRPTWPTLVAVLYTGLFTSLTAYFAWSEGVAVLGAQRAGVFLHMVPLFSALLSMLVLGEEPRPFHAIGLLLIIGGVTVAVRRVASR